MTHPENKVYIQVAKYQSEWLSFDYSTPEDTFRKEVLHKIDDPDINIYPHDWVGNPTSVQLHYLTNHVEPGRSLRVRPS